MRDLPTSLELIELGRRLLLDDILPLLPEARQRDIHLVATSMAIAAREATNGDRPLREILGQLRAFYDPHPPTADAAGPTLSRIAGEGAERCEAGEGAQAQTAALLRCFAADFRAGAFQTSESRERAARAILWRLTILKLREGNPQFLAAHGIV
jgi:hypothetical protein